MRSEWDDTPWQGMPVELPVPVNLGNRTAIARIAKQSRIATRAIDSYTTYPDWDQSILNAFGLTARPWRFPSINEALGVPSIFRSVSLIANTTGSLAMEAYRNGRLLTGTDVPRIVTRPDPFKTAQRFYRDTAYFLATRGEAWWWVAKRDQDGLPMSLIVVPPWEITVDAEQNRFQPVITWNIAGRSKVMPNEDMRQITLLPSQNGERGVGPLQLCGAAVSVAVESQEFAANFYAEGGYPSILIKAAGTLGTVMEGPHEGEEEANVLRDQWMEKDHNTPRVVDEGIESVEQFDPNASGAQMLDARIQNRGDVANMYGIPGALLEYSAPGSSLTYQNVREVFQLWVKAGLSVQFLVPIEEEMSDLLPRSTSAHFNVDSFDRADPKSRWETYTLMVGVLGAEEAAQVARQSEGFEAGDVEFMPVPPAPPAAFPTSLPVPRSAEAVRCSGKRVLRGALRPCNKLLAEAGPFFGRCPRCGAVYEAA